MPTPNRFKPVVWLSLLVSPWLAMAGFGADYPARDIRLVVPFEPGGAGDTTSRIIAEAANATLDGAEIAVVNRSGGGGIVGQTFVSRSRADGYTVLAMTSSTVTNPILKGASFSVEDFIPVAMYNFDPEVIAVATDSPIKNIDDLIAAASNGKPNMVIAGIATAHHMAGLAIEQNTGLTFNYLPLRGFGKQLQAVMGQHVDGAFWPLGEAASHIEAGSIRILALAADERDARFPEVPTFEEAGLGVSIWATFRGWAVPAGTPDEVVDALAGVLADVHASEAYRQRMTAAGYEPVYRGPQAFKTVIDEYQQQTSSVIEAHGLGR